MSLVFGLWEKRFFEGIELFNKKKFYEAHGAWELIWMDTPREDALSDFYKGLIQAAAVFEHIRRGNSSGALGLLKTASALLGRFVPRTLGLDTRALTADLESVLVQISGGQKLESIKTPQIKLWIESSSR